MGGRACEVYRPPESIGGAMNSRYINYCEKELDFRGVPETVKIIQVIQIETIVGQGIPDDPVRKVIQYWTLQGKLIGEDE
jgi:hypothetical protein